MQPRFNLELGLRLLVLMLVLLLLLLMKQLLLLLLLEQLLLLLLLLLLEEHLLLQRIVLTGRVQVHTREGHKIGEFAVGGLFLQLLLLFRLEKIHQGLAGNARLLLLLVELLQLFAGMMVLLLKLTS